MKILLFTIFTFMLGLLHLQAQTDLQKAEWFVNTDPGFNNANHINFPSNSDEVEWEFNLNNLDVGVHYLGVRVLDNNGAWSHTLTRSFLVLPPAQPSITYAEWYIDEDPGFRRANAVPIMADTATWEIDLSSLAVGVHYLHVRTQQASSAWTHTLTRAFLVAEEGESPIERIDYRYTDDRDNELQFSYELDVPQHYIDLDFEPDTTGLIGGENYELCFRVVTTDGSASAERCIAFEAEGMPSSVDDGVETSAIKLYPNPTQDWLQVELPSSFSLQQWSLIDASGQYHLQEKVNVQEQMLQINVGSLPKGYYALILETKSALIVRTVLIQ